MELAKNRSHWQNETVISCILLAALNSHKDVRKEQRISVLRVLMRGMLRGGWKNQKSAAQCLESVSALLCSALVNKWAWRHLRYINFVLSCSVTKEKYLWNAATQRSAFVSSLSIYRLYPYVKANKLSLSHLQIFLRAVCVLGSIGALFLWQMCGEEETARAAVIELHFHATALCGCNSIFPALPILQITINISLYLVPHPLCVRATIFIISEY